MRATIGNRVTWGDRGRFGKIMLIITWTGIVSILLSYLSVYISPVDVWLPAFFGLIYPYLLWLNVFTLGYWAVKKARLWIVPLIVILSGWNYLGAWYQFNSSGEAIDPKKEQVKVLSYNVRLFDLYNWSKNKETRNRIFNFLNDQDAEVMCFQEFYHRNGGTEFPTKDTMLTFLRAQNIFEHYTHEMHADQYFGLATFSTYPIVNSGAITFENDDNNACIYTDLLIGQDTLRVYNAHLSSIRLQREDYEAVGDEEATSQFRKHQKGQQQIFTRLKSAYIKRATQAEKVVKHVLTSPHHVVICGDFNDTPISYAYQLFESELTDAWRESGSGRGGTYLGKFPSFRIDFIFHSEGIHSYGFETHDVELSDHRPISCIVHLK